MWTSTYPWVNGVTGNSTKEDTSLNQLIGTPVVTTPDGPALPLGTLGQMLAQLAPAGVVYDVAYKGKWHLSYQYQRGLSLSQQQEPGNESKQASDDEDMATTFGFDDWTSPDFGTAISLKGTNVYTLGGGTGDNDARVATGTSYTAGGTVDSAADYLTKRFANGPPAQPFCLIAALLNPHDVWVSTQQQYAAAGYDAQGGEFPWRQAPYTEITDLPATYYSDETVLRNKPDAQVQYRAGLDVDKALDYLRFYAYLEVLSDQLLGDVLAALPPDQLDNTLIVRLADHGEMAMSQGGMTEKEAQAYNETILVPMVFSNPGLPQGEVCPALAALVDVVPTLADICGLTNVNTSFAIQGTSLADAILAGSAGTSYGQHLFHNPVMPVYALVDDQRYNSKYVVTGLNGQSQWQCELYDFSYDPTSAAPWPDEADNKIPVGGLIDATPASSPEIQALWANMHQALTDAMVAANVTLPSSWPPAPPQSLPQSD